VAKELKILVEIRENLIEEKNERKNSAWIQCYSQLWIWCSRWRGSRWILIGGLIVLLSGRSLCPLELHWLPTTNMCCRWPLLLIVVPGVRLWQCWMLGIEDRWIIDSCVDWWPMSLTVVSPRTLGGPHNRSDCLVTALCELVNWCFSFFLETI
jgi:hypothetical protein